MQRLALITGASSGIGRELAKLMAADGYRLILVARDQVRLQELADELAPAPCEVVATDLSESGAAKALWQRLEAIQSTGLDVLVNNAGFGRLGDFATTDQSTLQQMIQLNVTTLAELTHLALPGMLQRGGGRILNVASTAAFQPGPGMALYYATKAFVLSLSEAIDAEVAAGGVRITTLCPGPTRTEFQNRAWSDAETGSSDPQQGGRAMTASAVARAGYRGMLRGKRLVVPGLANKLLLLGPRFLPRGVVTRAIHRLQRRRANR